METFSILVDADIAQALKVLGIAIVTALAMGRTIIYLIEQYRAGNPNTLQVLDTATATLIDPIEASGTDEWLELQYIALENEQIKKAIGIILDVTDPEKDVDASEARKRLHKFLYETTDGDLNT